jgi:hypothetical protein
LSSRSKLKPFKTSKIHEINTQFSNLSDPIGVNITVPSLNSIPDTKLDKNNQLNQEIKLFLFSKPSIKENPTKWYSEKDTNPSLKLPSSYKKATDHTSHLEPLSSDDENEFENSLNDVADDLSQQDTIITYTSPDKPSYSITNKTKQTLPLLERIDEVSPHSKSSVSFRKIY